MTNESFFFLSFSFFFSFIDNAEWNVIAWRHFYSFLEVFLGSILRKNEIKFFMSRSIREVLKMMKQMMMMMAMKKRTSTEWIDVKTRHKWHVSIVVWWCKKANGSFQIFWRHDHWDHVFDPVSWISCTNKTQFRIQNWNSIHLNWQNSIRPKKHSVRQSIWVFFACFLNYSSRIGFKSKLFSSSFCIIHIALH